MFNVIELEAYFVSPVVRTGKLPDWIYPEAVRFVVEAEVENKDGNKP